MIIRVAKKFSRRNPQRRATWRYGSTYVVLAVLSASFAPSASAQFLKLGPVEFRMSASVSLEYNDNVNTAENSADRKSDYLLRVSPGLTGSMRLGLAGGQQLSLSTSFTYSKSLSGNRETEGFGAPATVSLSLPLQVGEWTLLVSDTFSMRNDAVEELVAIQQAQVVTYNNTASLTARRPLAGRWDIAAAASRRDKISPDIPDLDETLYNFIVTPGVTLPNNYHLGLALSYGLNDVPSTSPRDEGQFYGANVVLSGQFTPSMGGFISLGYALAMIDTASGTESVGGISSAVGLSYAHPLRPLTSHSISVFRSPGVTGVLTSPNVTEIYGVGYTISHQLNRYVTLSPTFRYNHLRAIGGNQERADFFTVDFNLSYRITRRLASFFNYRYAQRDSNLAGSSYEQNRMRVGFSYFL
jgi:hypothetical protein